MLSFVSRITVREIASAAALAVAMVVCGSGIFQFAQNSYGKLLPDFRAFYCGAAVMASGANPYFQEPLYSCEAEDTAPYMWRASGHVSNPAPLPPYALALFVPFTKIPYVTAALIWALALCVVYAATLLALRYLTGLSWPLLSAAILPGALMSISLGQIAPIAIGLLCVSAALARTRPQLAGPMAVLSLIEPHVAVPSCIALFAVNKRCRPGMYFSLFLLAGLSLLFGAPLTDQYLREVIPAHAASDVWDVGQFSGTLIVHMAGATDRAALLVGSLSYVLSCGIGIFLAIVLARREGDVAFAILIPIAFAVFGGSYLHWQQIVAAIPAALLLRAVEGRHSSLLVPALVILPVPWLYMAAWGFLIPMATVIVAALTWQCSKNVTATILASACAAAGLWVANHALPADHAIGAFKAIVSGGEFADTSWGQYVRARISSTNGVFWWAHFPTWAGSCLIVLACALSCARNKALTAHETERRREASNIVMARS